MKLTNYIVAQEFSLSTFRDIFPNYYSFWNCSTAKKGYSGTAVFIRKDIQCDISSTDNTESTAAIPTKSNKKQSKLTSLWKKPASEDSKISGDIPSEGNI